MATCPAVSQHSFILDPTEYKHSQAALLPAEGIGAHGNYFIRVSAQIRGSYLHVSGRGYTPAMEMLEYRGKFKFYGNVKLLQNGRQIIKQRLEREGEELWPDDRYNPIGSATICIPPSLKGTVTIEVEAGYELNSGSGFVTPIPPTSKLTIPL